MILLDLLYHLVDPLHIFGDIKLPLGSIVVHVPDLAKHLSF